VKQRCALFAGFACAAALSAPASAEWRPPDLRATQSLLADVLGANAKAAGAPSRSTQRHERWSYTNGERRLPVRVAVKGADFRATVTLGNAEYAGGRSDGVRWRSDANGIAHATLSDDQGDAIDRLPQSIFAFARADCELAGESDRFGPAWVVVDRAPRDKPHWFYIEKSSGLIAHEITREGARTIVTSFDTFETVAGTRRPWHWRVADGDASHDLDVRIEAVVPEPVDALDVARPQTRRVFEPSTTPADGVVPLRAFFGGRRIFVDVEMAGGHRVFILDTGTASITLDSDLAERLGLGPVLEHATVPKMTIGALAMSNVSTLAIPLSIGPRNLAGILGYDFFVGHVVHVDYEHKRVEVLTPEATQRAFAAPHVIVTSAYYDEGAPLVRAAFGTASGDRFALDTGSPYPIVLAPFTRRHAAEIEAHWVPATFGAGTPTRDLEYLEGSILVAARRAPAFTLGPLRIADLTVGVEESNPRSNAIDIALDGIIGTDQMALFDWWFDYDNGRIAMRRNGLE
jgi:hypothetical protein